MASHWITDATDDLALNKDRSAASRQRAGVTGGTRAVGRPGTPTRCTAMPLINTEAATEVLFGARWMASRSASTCWATAPTAMGCRLWLPPCAGLRFHPNERCSWPVATFHPQRPAPGAIAHTESIMSNHKWQFTSRFRRHAFGWRSDTPVQRIKEAISEIKRVARKEPVLAAEGAITLLEKLSPALEQVDSSSGALGSAVNKAIDTLVPIIVKADVQPKLRKRWLERLWQALQDDEIPYIELLADYWGELCVTPELASYWADEFLPVVERVWSPKTSGHGFFKGTSACLASMYAAGRHQELLALLDKARFKWWHNRRWGVKALAAIGRKAEAIRYAEESRGINDPGWQIAKACEEILLSSGLLDEAYRRYAIEANQGTTNLATFRAIAKKYPNKQPDEILRDLVSSTPSAEGKWFAAAKDAGLFALAVELITRSPTDPRTLTRAARDYAEEHPAFALAAGLAALRWISLGYGYEITGGDVLDAYTAVTKAALNAGVPTQQVIEQIREMIASTQPGNSLMTAILARHLSN